MPRPRIDLRGRTAGTAYPIPAVAPSGQARIWYDTASDKVVLSTNGAAATNLHAEVASGSDTWDPGSIADGDAASTTVEVTGAALGQFALASFSLDITGLTISAYVSDADEVTVVLANNTGSAVDLAEGTVRARVL